MDIFVAEKGGYIILALKLIYEFDNDIIFNDGPSLLKEGSFFTKKDILNAAKMPF